MYTRSVMVRTRIAPSPTGFPHIGTIWQALIDYSFARKHNGQFIVRIEDTDQKRFVEGAEEALFKALDWFGLVPDESPKHGGDLGPYRQSERLELYQKYAQQLVEQGDAYYCFCSPEHLAKVREKCRQEKRPPMYDRRCRGLSVEEAKKRANSGEPRVIRMKIPDGQEEIVCPDLLRGEISFVPSTVDDQVLLKSDGFPTYHLAVVVDDYEMKVSHVVRGEEWLSSFPKHVLLYDFFGWEKPVFVHTPILRNPGGSKLSKRQGHTAVSWYQEQGFLPEALLNFLALLGWSHPEEKDIFSLDEFIEKFDLKDLNPTAPVFDLKKLEWMNGEYIRMMSDEELLEVLRDNSLADPDEDLWSQIIPLIKERIKRLSDIPTMTGFFFERVEIGSGAGPVLFGAPLSGEIRSFKPRGTEKEAKGALEELRGVLEALPSPWTHEGWEQAIRAAADELGWKHGDLFMLLRVAITGSKVSPPLFESMEILGKEECLERVEAALEQTP